MGVEKRAKSNAANEARRNDATTTATGTAAANTKSVVANGKVATQQKDDPKARNGKTSSSKNVPKTKPVAKPGQLRAKQPMQVDDAAEKTAGSNDVENTASNSTTKQSQPSRPIRAAASKAKQQVQPAKSAVNRRKKSAVATSTAATAAESNPANFYALTVKLAKSMSDLPLRITAKSAKLAVPEWTKFASCHATNFGEEGQDQDSLWSTQDVLPEVTVMLGALLMDASSVGSVVAAKLLAYSDIGNDTRWRLSFNDIGARVYHRACPGVAEFVRLIMLLRANVAVSFGVDSSLAQSLSRAIEAALSLVWLVADYESEKRGIDSRALVEKMRALETKLAGHWKAETFGRLPEVEISSPWAQASDGVTDAEAAEFLRLRRQAKTLSKTKEVISRDIEHHEKLYEANRKEQVSQMDVAGDEKDDANDASAEDTRSGEAKSKGMAKSSGAKSKGIAKSSGAKSKGIAKSSGAKSSGAKSSGAKSTAGESPDGSSEKSGDAAMDTSDVATTTVSSSSLSSSSSTLVDSGSTRRRSTATDERHAKELEDMTYLVLPLGWCEKRAKEAVAKHNALFDKLKEVVGEQAPMVDTLREALTQAHVEHWKTKSELHVAEKDCEMLSAKLKVQILEDIDNHSGRLVEKSAGESSSVANGHGMLDGNSTSSQDGSNRMAADSSKSLGGHRGHVTSHGNSNSGSFSSSSGAASSKAKAATDTWPLPIVVAPASHASVHPAPMLGRSERDKKKTMGWEMLKQRGFLPFEAPIGDVPSVDNWRLEEELGLDFTLTSTDRRIWMAIGQVARRQAEGGDLSMVEFGVADVMQATARLIAKAGKRPCGRSLYARCAQLLDGFVRFGVVRRMTGQSTSESNDDGDKMKVDDAEDRDGTPTSTSSTSTSSTTSVPQSDDEVLTAMRARRAPWMLQKPPPLPTKGLKLVRYRLTSRQERHEIFNQKQRRPTPKQWLAVAEQVRKEVLTDQDILAMKAYKPRSEEVYGETNPLLVGHFARRLRVVEQDKFMDIGSGIGTVAMQVSAVTGCDSKGVELRPELHEIAMRLRTRFEEIYAARGWTGCGKVELMCGDASVLDRLEAVAVEENTVNLKTSTVIYLNNYVFPAELDELMFAVLVRTMCEGTQVISMKPYASRYRPGSKRYEGHPLDFFEFPWGTENTPPDSVSWCSSPISYFIYSFDPLQRGRRDAHLLPTKPLFKGLGARN